MKKVERKREKKRKKMKSFGVTENTRREDQQHRIRLVGTAEGYIADGFGFR